jgi:hypothetical protein
MKININWNKFDSKLYKPLVNNEIPDFTPGTLSYDDYWDEQDHRCLVGYKPKPFMPKITNEHYFYMNMCKIKLLEPGTSRKKAGFPFYRELDRRLFGELDQAKKDKYGLIIGKPRQVGLSWLGGTTCYYEMLFHKGNEVGVAAGLDEKAQDFKGKIEYLFKHVRKEYRVSMSTNNEDEIVLSYKYKENKQDVEIGLESKLHMRTMFSKPTGFEGKDNLSVVVFEEAGLFEDIIAAYRSSEPTWKSGAIQFGTPLVYGTGGEIEKGSKGYKTMWDAPMGVYNLKKVFVSAVDFFPGDGLPDKVTGKKISFFDMKTGRTNSKAAFNYIMAEREAKKGEEGFIKTIQTYPLKESEIFVKTKGGMLNRQKLSAQKNNLDNCPFIRMKGRLEWVPKDSTTMALVARAKNLKEIDKIHFSRGSKLKFVEDDVLGTIHKLLDPMDHSRYPFNPDIIGCDSYDDEVEEGTNSLGGTIVYRCFHGVTKPYDIPIAYIKDRGTSDADDEFYSNSFKLCVWYDSEMLLEYTKIVIKTYFDDVGGYKFLKGRPDLSGESYNSKAVNKVGFKMSNQHAKKLIVRLLRAEVNQNYGNIWFEELLDDLIDFGEKNSDLGSALGMVMVSKLEMFGLVSDGIEDDDDDLSELESMGTWVFEDGNAIFKNYNDLQNSDSFDITNMNIFDPEYDLEGQEKIDFIEDQNNAVEQIKKKRKEVFEKYGNDIMAFVIEEHHQSINSKFEQTLKKD